MRRLYFGKAMADGETAAIRHIEDGVIACITVKQPSGWSGHHRIVPPAGVIQARSGQEDVVLSGVFQPGFEVIAAVETAQIHDHDTLGGGAPPTFVLQHVARRWGGSGGGAGGQEVAGVRHQIRTGDLHPAGLRKYPDPSRRPKDDRSRPLLFEWLRCSKLCRLAG